MNTKNKTIVNYPTISINHNVLKYKDSAIQISNITQCEIAPEPPMPYPNWLYAGTLIGVFLLFSKYFAWGLFLLMAISAIFYLIWSTNAKKKIYFTLELNSGNIVLFSSYDKDFLWQAQEAVLNCF